MFGNTKVEGGRVEGYPCSGAITSYFGDLRPLPHTGVDIAPAWPAADIPVLAPCDAEVADVWAIGVGADDWEQTFGNSVRLRHNGYVTLYAHLRDNPVVYEGQQVRAGDLLGYVGSTGQSTGPHLHWGMAVEASNPYFDRNSRLLDPLSFIPPPPPEVEWMAVDKAEFKRALSEAKAAAQESLAQVEAIEARYGGQ